MTWIGRLSYAWYLWHWPAIGIALVVAAQADSGVVRAGVIGAAVAISLLLSAASHKAVEEPFRRSRRFAFRPAYLFAGAIGLTIIPVVLGSSLLAFDSELTTDIAAGSGSQMTAVEAANDTTEPTLAECHAGFEAIQAPAGCVYGDPDGGTTIALVGDSHAQHWLPAFDVAGEQQAWRVLAWTKDSCTAIDVPLHNDRLERPYPECTQWRQAVLAQLEMEPVDIVVFSDSYNYGHMVMGGPEGDPLGVQSVVLDEWRSGAERTFADYLQFAEGIVLMRDTPWAGFNVPSCLSENPDEPALCSFGLAGTAWLDEPYLAEELEAGARAALPLDMTPFVCDADPCPVVTDTGIIKYRDSHHLTRTFSAELGGPLATTLTAVLAEAGQVISR